MKVGVFGGSFDPIHNGHINLAEYVLEHTDLDEVWLMVSPLNPLKPQGYVATDLERFQMARLAVAGHPGIKVSDFEFSLPIPSYTYNTLCRLKEAYPDIDFSLIVGGDNWATFERWRNPQEILDEFGVIVYPRPGEEIKTLENSQLIIDHSSLIILEGAPEMPISSTEIRSILKGSHSGTKDKSSLLLDSLSLEKALPESVLCYISSRHLYSDKYTHGTEASQPPRAVFP